MSVKISKSGFLKERRSDLTKKIIVINGKEELFSIGFPFIDEYGDVDMNIDNRHLDGSLECCYSPPCSVPKCENCLVVDKKRSIEAARKRSLHESRGTFSHL